MSKQIGNYVRTKGLPKKRIKSKTMGNNLEKAKQETAKIMFDSSWGDLSTSQLLESIDDVCELYAKLEKSREWGELNDYRIAKIKKSEEIENSHRQSELFNEAYNLVMDSKYKSWKEARTELEKRYLIIKR